MGHSVCLPLPADALAFVCMLQGSQRLTRGSSDKPRENCQGCLGIVSFLSLPRPPQKKTKEGKKEQRFWLFASLLGDSQMDLL